MTRKNKRLVMIAGGLAFLGVAAALVLTAFEDSVVFFHSPSDLAEKPAAPDRRIRIGGLVEDGSVERGPADGEVRFRVTDGNATLPVRYVGLLPDLFREGQGIIAQGTLVGGTFQAEEVLAKHDENYMPREVAEALKKQGYWKKEGAKP
ncbi:MAG: cytochrome c maturation protein CcmE [Alphaproteobacteria bacterium]|nr:cytochrome c maturation protein CcmE [Alphaproteobacteria bacterium]